MPLIDALPVGLWFGLLFGPSRLAGVDYSKWYRNPGEVAELSDRTWIGFTKWTSLSAARWLSSAFVLVLAALLLDDLLPGRFTVEWWFAGVLLGIGLAQGAVEVAWRLGMRAKKQSLSIRLAKPPTTPYTPLAVPRGGRRLIVCCDGTWNSPAQGRETNVRQLLRAIEPVSAAGISQVSYYHLGVGTGNFVDRLIGGGVGIGLSSSIKACYDFLVENYQSGDDILLFGFSRGAYVVRSLAGLIGLVGLLHKEEMARFREVWDYYSLRRVERAKYDLTAIAPKRRTPIEISCVGVWDTVGALGVPGARLCSSTYAFHDTSLGPHVRHAFQALAMDERRGNFQPAIWVRQANNPEQVLEQVWFPGVHSDIGGGYANHGLGDATLLWMATKLNQHNLLDLNLNCVKDSIQQATAELYAVGTLHDSRTRFWKLLFCPIPRPVGITDDSEMIHDSAFDRARAPPSRVDAYAAPGRRGWLQTIPKGKIAARSTFERNALFTAVPPGTPLIPIVRRKSGICARLESYLGGA